MVVLVAFLAHALLYEVQVGKGFWVNWRLSQINLEVPVSSPCPSLSFEEQVAGDSPLSSPQRSALHNGRNLHKGNNAFPGVACFCDSSMQDARFCPFAFIWNNSNESDQSQPQPLPASITSYRFFFFLKSWLSWSSLCRSGWLRTLELRDPLKWW